MLIITENSKHSIINIDLLKSHLRLEHNCEDEYLKVLIEAATDILEKSIEISILKKKYKYTGEYIDIIPIQPVIKIHSKKHNEITFYAGIAESPEIAPIDLKYAVLQIAKNMYEGSDNDMLNSHYIKHVINSYKAVSVL